MNGDHIAHLRPQLALEPLGDAPAAYTDKSGEELETLAASGDIHAITTLALRAEYDNRPLVAFRWWQVGAEQSDTAAFHNLGIHAFEEGNFQGATSYWKEAAMQGCVEAQHNLGVILHDTKGTS